MCKQCEIKPVYEFTNQRKLCKTCFVRWFQKKVLYTIRRFEMIKLNDVIGYKTGRDFRSVVLEDVLKMFAKRAMVELVKLPISTLRVYTKEVREPLRGPEKSFSKILTKGKKLDKIAIASTTDLEVDKIIHFLIKGKVKNLKNVAPVNNQIIKPLYLFLDKEVLLYAKLRKLKFDKEIDVIPQAYPEKSFTKILTEGKNKISLFINELEKTHPEVKQAVVGSYLGEHFSKYI